MKLKELEQKRAYAEALLDALKDGAKKKKEATNYIG